jgi:hypothetical protein
MKPTAKKTVIDHACPCWHCSKRLQSCTPEGKLDARRSGISPNYKGSVVAFVVEIDQFPRRLHRACAKELGFKVV